MPLRFQDELGSDLWTAGRCGGGAVVSNPHAAKRGARTRARCGAAHFIVGSCKD
jgi:hypothetical protein